MDVDSGFPVASVFAEPMTVDNPMSCFAREVGDPVLHSSTSYGIELTSLACSGTT